MELRQDYLTAQWVCIAPARTHRPHEFESHPHMQTDSRETCPFCLENRHLTEPETFVHENVRVVPNIYPALDPFSPQGYGFHEVVIDDHHHDYSPAHASPQEMANVLTAIVHRVNHFAQNPALQYVQVFKNHGFQAGASIVHAHCQIMALPFVPALKTTMAERFQQHIEETGQCYLCQMAQQLGSLKVYENQGFVAFSPHAALYRYGVNIMPKAHITDIRGMDANTLLQLGEALVTVLAALAQLHENFSYNICFHCAPLRLANNAHWHFYLQIIPRSTAGFAGFELGTGCFINGVDPLEAAENIRTCMQHTAHRPLERT